VIADNADIGSSNVNMASAWIAANQQVTWVQILASVPAAVMLWVLLVWNPRGRRPWFVAAAMMIYIAAYYWLFVRGR
jgi:hypothetical protein